MRIVIDANIIISAMLRDGSTRRALLETRSHLFAPLFLRAELLKHRAALVKRANVTEAVFDARLDVLAIRVQWVGDEEIRSHLERAREAMCATDVHDAPYLAAAVAVGADAIWSEDAHFDRQALVPRTRHPGRITR